MTELYRPHTCAVDIERSLMTDDYDTPADRLGRWLTAPHTRRRAAGALAAAGGGALPAWQITHAAATAGQPSWQACATAAATVVLAAVAAREIHVRRTARTGALGPAVLLAAALALTSAAALVGAGATAPRQWSSLLALWPTICAAGALTCRLTRPTPAHDGAVTGAPPPSRAADADEPDTETTPATKRAQLLALAAQVPPDDPRGPSRLAADLAHQIGMSASTARRYLAEHRRESTGPLPQAAAA